MTSHRSWIARLAPLGVLGLLVWFVRARNIAEDPAQQNAWSILPVIVFMAASVYLLVIAWRGHTRGGLSSRERTTVIAIAAGSSLWWVVRALEIMSDDYSLAFTGVHLILAGSIVAASVWAVAGLRAPRGASASTSRL